MNETLRQSVLLSVQRALVGEITPEMQAVAVEISPAAITVVLYVDAGTPDEIASDFDAGAVTQIVADFCWPERGDPVVEFQHILVPPEMPVPLRDGLVLVFARADVRFS